MNDFEKSGNERQGKSKLSSGFFCVDNNIAQGGDQLPFGFSP